jgi:hypothetical protein
VLVCGEVEPGPSAGFVSGISEAKKTSPATAIAAKQGAEDLTEMRRETNDGVV